MPEQSRARLVRVSNGDDQDTTNEKWQRNEALAAEVAIPQARPAHTSAARRGFMTPEPSSHGGLPRRLAVSAVLCERLVAQGCSGAEWNRFVDTTYKKATKVVYRWLKEGRIFAMAAKIGRPVAPGDVADWSHEDLRELAHEVVQETFDGFRERLLAGHYDATRGATLFTYFMNAVAHQFSNVFRRTVRARKTFQHHVDLYADPYELDQPDLDDYYAAQARFTELLFALLRGIRAPQQRDAAWLYFVEGLSCKQIARQLGVSENAAGGLLTRARTAMKEIYEQQQEAAGEGGRP